MRGYYDDFGLPNIEDKPDLSELEIVFTGLSVDDEGDSWQFIQPEQDGDNARLLVSLGQIYLKLLPDLGSEEKLKWEEFTIRYNQRLMQALINGLKFYAESKRYPETIRKYQKRQRLRDWFVDIPTSGMVELGVNDISSNRFAGLGAFMGAVGLSRVVNYRNRRSEVEKVPDRVRRQIVDTREDYRVPRGYVAPLDLGNTGVTRFVIRAALGQEVS